MRAFAFPVSLTLGRYRYEIKEEAGFLMGWITVGRQSPVEVFKVEVIQWGEVFTEKQSLSPFALFFYGDGKTKPIQRLAMYLTLTGQVVGCHVLTTYRSSKTATAAMKRYRKSLIRKGVEVLPLGTLIVSVKTPPEEPLQRFIDGPMRFLVVGREATASEVLPLESYLAFYERLKYHYELPLFETVILANILEVWESESCFDLMVTRLRLVLELIDKDDVSYAKRIAIFSLLGLPLEQQALIFWYRSEFDEE